ncbi:MAG: hypothetical protein R8P61_07510 [Bacteroidia bacterium]|nr:hypothetical protein [Bacteroidia bacterium]
MRFYILLGVSGSLSTSMAEQLLSTSNELFFASPDENMDLRKFARMRQLALNFEQMDTKDAVKTQAWIEKVLDKMEEEDWKEVSLIVMTEKDKSGIKSSLLSDYCNSYQRMVQPMDKEKRILICGRQEDQSAKPGSAVGGKHHDQLPGLIRELALSQIGQKFPVKYSSILLNAEQQESNRGGNSARQTHYSPELLACELVKLFQAADFGEEKAIVLKDLI